MHSQNDYLSWLICLLVLTLSTGRASGQTNAKPDTLFNQPYVDVDEWRDKPVRHRYVHGGFKGTNTRFLVYVPPKEQYQGLIGHRRKKAWSRDQALRLLMNR